MSTHLTEEEQLEVLKRWWKDYGKTVITVIVLCLIGYFGFTEWQKRQKLTAEANSYVYDRLLQTVSAARGESLDAEGLALVAEAAASLKQADANSQYAHNAALHLAKIAVESDKLDQAAVELKWVLDNKPNLMTQQITTLRLARVELAMGNLDKAEALLVNPADAFKSEFTEVRGDILVARGDISGARALYEQSLAETDLKQNERSSLLQLKLDDLKQAPVAGKN